MVRAFDKEFYDATRRVEFAPSFAFGAGELGEEVFVDSTEDVFGTGGFVANLYIRDGIDELTEFGFVQTLPSIVLGQDAFEARIVSLNTSHGVVDDLADCWLFRLSFKVLPTGFDGHPENVDGSVFVGVFRVGSGKDFTFEFCVLFFEGVGDVFEEEEAEHDVLVFRGVHASS